MPAQPALLEHHEGVKSTTRFKLRSGITPLILVAAAPPASAATPIKCNIGYVCVYRDANGQGPIHSFGCNGTSHSFSIVGLKYNGTNISLNDSISSIDQESRCTALFAQNSDGSGPYFDEYTSSVQGLTNAFHNDDYSWTEIAAAG